MIKLSLSPDLRFANDKLVNRKATVTLGKGENAPAFNGTFSIMPASASTQAAITAEASVSDDGWIIKSEILADPEQNKVELKANVIKTVHFNKGQTKVDTGLVLKEDEYNDDGNTLKLWAPVDATSYELIALKHGEDKEGKKAVRTLQIKRLSETAEAETADVEIADVVVATGSLVGNTMGFKIKGGDPVRMHALCNWVGHVGLKENLESFKVVTKDHDAIVLSLETHSDLPSMPGASPSAS
jgi:hypothetical protein